MALHLVKLCVGIDSFEELRDWIPVKLARMAAEGRKPEHVHVTRMVPKRTGELLRGGSLYWVIRGHIRARQSLLAIEPFRDSDGVRRCRLVMAKELIATRWQPRRAFQGWRYLEGKDAPPDLVGNADDELPAALKEELGELGLM